MVQRMKQTVICLIMALALLVAPIAHAAGVLCPDDGIQKIELSKLQKVSEDGKQTNKATQQCAHCVCCSHSIADRAAAKITGPSREESKLAFSTDADKLTSLSVGPPLEPPSHA